MVTLFSISNLFNLFIEDHLNELVGCLSHLLDDVPLLYSKWRSAG